MLTRTVLVFDICSSTTMLDMLHSQSSVDMYIELLNKITKFVDLESVFAKYEVYKFLGDGLILLFPEETSADMVLHFSMRLVLKCDALLRAFASSKLPNQPISRIGITCGIDRGWLLKERIMDKDEYVGRPINVACRLQSSLSTVEGANKVLITNGVKERLTDSDLKLACYRTMRKLRNLDEKEMPYFEFDPLAFDTTLREKQSRELIRKVFEERIRTDKDFARRIGKMLENSNAKTSKEFYMSLRKALKSARPQQ